MISRPNALTMLQITKTVLAKWFANHPKKNLKKFYFFFAAECPQNTILSKSLR